MVIYVQIYIHNILRVPKIIKLLSSSRELQEAKCNFLANHVVNEWNSVTKSVIHVTSINTFKGKFKRPKFNYFKTWYSSLPGPENKEMDKSFGPESQRPQFNTNISASEASILVTSLYLYRIWDFQ